MIDGRIIGKTANSSQGSHQQQQQHSRCWCRIHAGGGDSRELNSGSPGECHPVRAAAALLSWLRWEPVGGPGIAMCKPQERTTCRNGTLVGNKQSSWQPCAKMCPAGLRKYAPKRLTFKSTACQAALTRRFNLHQRKPREFPLVFNCGLVWPPLPARRLSDTRDGPAWKDPYIKETVRVTWLIDIVPILTASKAATMSSSDQWIC